LCLRMQVDWQGVIPMLLVANGPALEQRHGSSLADFRGPRSSEGVCS
jgi:hypothetical protein